MTMIKSELIKRIGDVAVAMYKEKRILPSLIIAQGCLESGWGTSVLSTVANNYFGLNNYNYKYLPETKEVISSGYDEPSRPYPYYALSVPQEVNGKWEYNVEVMCKFTSLEQGIECLYRWYLLRSKYDGLNKITDYKQACQFVKNKEYATDSRYADSLIRIIEQYNLTEYDKQAFESVEEKHTLMYVQVGSFEILANALNMATALSKKGFDALVKQATYKGKTVFRVQTGAFENRENALKMQQAVKDLKGIYSCAFITNEGGDDIKFIPKSSDV